MLLLLCGCMSAIIAWFFLPAFGKISFSKGFNQKKSKPDDSTYIQTSYAPRPDSWIEFNIPKGSEILKIVSNVMYYYVPDKKSFLYTLDFEILNDERIPIYSNSYSQVGRVRLFREKGSNRILSDPFLIDVNKYLTKNYEVTFPLLKLKNPSIFRLKWTSKNPLVTDVLLRLSRLSEKSNKTEENQWLRMPSEKKEELAQNSIFPFDSLTAKEIKNSLSRKWRSMSQLKENSLTIDIYRIGIMPSNSVRSFTIANPESDISTKKRPIKSELFRLYLQSAGGTFKSPSDYNIKKAERLFLELFNIKEVTREMIDDFNKLGFEIKEIKTKNNLYIVIYEQPTHKDGKGFYIFCRNSKIKNITLEMPHRFFDNKTGTIGFKLITTGYYCAGAWNTVHRYQTPNLMLGSSDMAHNKRSYFHAFSRAFLKSSEENSVMLQLHGYNEKKHKVSIDEPSAILSDGTNQPSEKFLKLCLAIRDFLKLPVKIHPYDSNIEELSAQENVTADSFSKSQSDKMFVHFEMNKLLRNKLLNDKDFLKSFSLELNSAAGKMAK